MGTLYIVGTPIGNLEDITLRALSVLGAVRLIAAEDTRLTRRLLARHGVATPLVSCHAHSPPAARAALVAALDAGDLALVTDAGTPGVSDPGAALVAEALAAGHRVSPVPGPSAVAAALSVAGMAADHFTFVGFLPRRAVERRARLAALAPLEGPLVAYEAPHRLVACLEDMLAAWGDRPLCVARELTKRFEDVWHGQLAAALARWRAESPRGEYTLVVAGRPAAAAPAWSDAAIREALQALRAAGLTPRAAAKQLAPAAGRPAREIYRLWEHGP